MYSHNIIDGRVFSCGSNKYGQLGLRATVASLSTPLVIINIYKLNLSVHCIYMYLYTYVTSWKLCIVQEIHTTIYTQVYTIHCT